MVNLNLFGKRAPITLAPDTQTPQGISVQGGKRALSGDAQFDRILTKTPAGYLFGDLAWQAARGAKHTLKTLEEATERRSDISHFVLFQSAGALVYGMFCNKSTEEDLRLPGRVHSAAHCFAKLVGTEHPNAALILNLPPSAQRRESSRYVVVLLDGVPSVDTICDEMGARNSLGSQDRAIWSDSPLDFPGCFAADFGWLCGGVSKGSRLARIPISPWPIVAIGLAIALAGVGWLWYHQVKKNKALQEAKATQLALDPVPKYLSALDREAPKMANHRADLTNMVQSIFERKVVVSGWSMAWVTCTASAQSCTTQWSRRGGTFDDLRSAFPDDLLLPAGPDKPASPASSSTQKTFTPAPLDGAQTQRKFNVNRINLLLPAQSGGLKFTDLMQQTMDASVQWQIWKTAGLLIEIKPAVLWPPVPGVSPSFKHPQALVRGEMVLRNVPGPFLLEALQMTPGWINWDVVRAEVSEGEMRSRLKFTVTGNYYAKAD
jgi:hypothetical protein